MAKYALGSLRVIDLPESVHVEFKCPKCRQDTFKGHTCFNVSADWLALAGFFYQADRQRPKATTCFHCDVAIDTWSLGDNPYVKHAQANAACEYLRLVAPRELIAEQDQTVEGQVQQPEEISRVQKQAFIDAALKSKAMSICPKELKIPVLERIIFLRDLYSNDEGHSHLQTALDEKEVKAAILELKNNKSLRDVFDRSVVDDLDASNDSEQSTEYAEDIERMRQENACRKSWITCKACHIRESSILHLPCGHKVYCGPCSAGMSECAYPGCGKTIVGRVYATLVSTTSVLEDA